MRSYVLLMTHMEFGFVMNKAKIKGISYEAIGIVQER